jgi:adenine-specific DNA-methyltransferase
MATKNGKKNDRPRTEKVGAELHNPIAEQLAALRAAMPHIFTEGKIDPDKLRQVTGDMLDERPERYSFTWAGRRDAIRILQTPTRATLVPCREESVNFDTTQNVFIEGDNLEVMKVIQKSLARRVKVIIIDPPYNTGKEFVYSDNFTDPLATYLTLTGQRDAEGNLLTSNPETSGRFHSAWLTMVYPRLFIARQLLAEDGVIFVSIDDTEMPRLRQLMDELFGEENFVGTIVWKGATDNNPTQIATEHEYIVCYARSKAALPTEWKNGTHTAKSAMLTEYRTLRSKYKNDPETIQIQFRRFIKANAESLAPLTHYDRVDERGVYTGSRKVHNPKPGGYQYDVFLPGTTKACARPVNGYRYPQNRMDELIHENRVIYPEDESQIIQIKEYLEDYERKLASVVELDSRTGSNELKDLFGDKPVFKNPKPSLLYREILDFCVSPRDIVLDFFAGTGTTAQTLVAMGVRVSPSPRFVLVQLPEPVNEKTEEGRNALAAGMKTIADICKERLRRVAKQVEGRSAGQLKLRESVAEIDAGFRVFKLAESHFRRWKGAPDSTWAAAVREMELFVDPLLEGWGSDGVLYEVILREGFSLTSRVTPLTDVKTNRMLRVEDPDKDQAFLISLDDEIKDATLKALKLGKDDRVILRDVALTDTQIANLALQCRLKTI